MMRQVRSGLTIALAGLLLPAAASAPETAPAVIIVPQLATPENVATPAGDTRLIARYVADVITAALRPTRELVPIGPENARVHSHPAATPPPLAPWRKTG